MPALLCDRLQVPNDAYPYRWTLTLDDGRTFRIYNLVLQDERWREVGAEHATHRVFVNQDGDRFVYRFKSTSKRDMAGRAELLARQLEDALRTAPVKRSATVRWRLDACYFTDDAGAKWRVYDAKWEFKRFHVSPPGRDRRIPNRMFITADPAAWRRLYHFRGEEDIEPTAAALVWQLKNASLIPGPKQTPSGSSDWKKNLTPEQFGGGANHSEPAT